MKTRNSHGLLQLGREAVAYCQCASALISGNKALFVSVDLIGEKNKVILEWTIRYYALIGCLWEVHSCLAISLVLACRGGMEVEGLLLERSRFNSWYTPTAFGPLMTMNVKDDFGRQSASVGEGRNDKDPNRL